MDALAARKDGGTVRHTHFLYIGDLLRQRTRVQLNQEIPERLTILIASETIDRVQGYKDELFRLWMLKWVFDVWRYQCYWTVQGILQRDAVVAILIVAYADSFPWPEHQVEELPSLFIHALPIQQAYRELPGALLVCAFLLRARRLLS